MKPWLAQSVHPACEDDSYWVLHEWLHALKQQPIQITEVGAELLSLCFLDLHGVVTF